MAQDGRAGYFSFVHEREIERQSVCMCVFARVGEYVLYVYSGTVIWSWTLFVDTKKCGRNFLTSLRFDLQPNWLMLCIRRAVPLLSSPSSLNSCLSHNTSPACTLYPSFFIPPLLLLWTSPDASIAVSATHHFVLQPTGPPTLICLPAIPSLSHPLLLLSLFTELNFALKPCFSSLVYTFHSCTLPSFNSLALLFTARLCFPSLRKICKRTTNPFHLFVS